MNRFWHARWTALAAVVLMACSDSPSETHNLTIQAVAGAYGASGNFGALSFTTTSSGMVIDWLEQGASISLRLNADRTTEGELFVPGADEDGGDFVADLGGTWQLVDNKVTLTHDADTFLRDMTLTVDDDRLDGDETFSDTRIRLTLLRQ
jgi:hypothetical protein